LRSARVEHFALDVFDQYKSFLDTRAPATAADAGSRSTGGAKKAPVSQTGALFAEARRRSIMVRKLFTIDPTAGSACSRLLAARACVLTSGVDRHRVAVWRLSDVARHDCARPARRLAFVGERRRPAITRDSRRFGAAAERGDENVERGM